MKNKALQQAKLPRPLKKTVDVLRLNINQRKQVLVIIKDNSVIREREKAII